ncbi:MAG: hypothetical protein HYV09_11090 [Deltaproteobacteria bacterium]|nr:hypothetical protein [Deltaproteobacteria bacterium]
MSVDVQQQVKRGVERLLAESDVALAFRTQRDLLGRRVDPTVTWSLPEVERTLRRQAPDGRFARGGLRPVRSAEDYDQLETFEVLLELVSKVGLGIEHRAIARAADWLLGRQTQAGDFRGILGSQYTPYYSAAIAAVLVEAGVDDPRIDRCMRWLLSMRQADGGWAIPVRTRAEGSNLSRAMTLAKPLAPDRERPSSHLVTGIVLRAFAAHPRWRRHQEIAPACRLLASRMFQADAYADRRAASYWRKLAFPFRWTDALSALDALSLLGVSADDPDVERGLRWLCRKQRRDGSWASGYAHAKDPRAALWVTFAACRTLARFCLGG